MKTPAGTPLSASIMQEPPELEASHDPLKIEAVKAEAEDDDSDTDIDKPAAIEEKKDQQALEAKDAKSEDSKPMAASGLLGKLGMFWHEVKEGAKEICAERY